MIFDAYLMVDWSASSTPKTGRDSIWYAYLEAGQSKPKTANPPTRHEAVQDMIELLSDATARGLKVLVGFDFAFGYPRDFAKALNLRTAGWQGVWAEIFNRITDQPNNQNNRFEVAAQFNQKISATTGPFWGCPKESQNAFLESTKPYENLLVQEFRLCEKRLKGIKSVWQLYGAGCVGSQTLMGIKHLEALRRHPWLMDEVQVWPFETGLKTLERGDVKDIVFAEIYPSQLVLEHSGRIKDAEQVNAMALHYHSLDQQGALSELFAGDPLLDPGAREIAETIEGWVLGVGADPQAQARAWLASYLKTPEAIYEKSRQMIEAEIDVSAFDGVMKEVATRMIHACGDVSLKDNIHASPGAAETARQALEKGATVICDVEMVVHGIIQKRLPANNRVICRLNDPGTPDKAKELATTRSAAAVEFWGEDLTGAVVVIGNAPTALFHLIEGVLEGRFQKPACIIACPVGFVGAAESKETLIALCDELEIPYIAVRGRRGGSAIAAAALNAVAKKGIAQ